MDKIQEFRQFVIDHEDDLIEGSFYDAWQRSKQVQKKLMED